MAGLEDLYNQLFGAQEQQKSSVSAADYFGVTPRQTSSPSSLGGVPAGYRRATDLERLFHKTQMMGQGWTRSINKALGIGDENGDYDITSELTNLLDVNDENGNLDFGKVVTTPFRGVESASRILRSLPGMAITGWSEAPAYMYTAATGSPLAQEGAMDENGNIIDKEVDFGQRLGAGVYGALDFIPVGWGAIGTKAGGAALKPLVKSATGEALKYSEAQAIKRFGRNALGEEVKMKYGRAAAANALGQSFEEGLEEGIQQIGQNVLEERPWDYQLVENVVGGALAGGVMGGVKGPGMAFNFNRSRFGDSEIGEGEQRLGEVTQTEARRDFETDYDLFQDNLAAVEEEFEKDSERYSMIPGSSRAIGYSTREGMDMDEMQVSLFELSKIVYSESLGYQRRDADGNYNAVDTKMTNYLNDFRYDQQGGSFNDQMSRAIKANDLQRFSEMLNEYIRQKGAFDIYVVKQPGGARGPMRMRMTGVNTSNYNAISQAAAWLLNADFDSDQYSIFVDNENKFAVSPYVSEQLTAEDTYSDISKKFNEIISVTSRKSRIASSLKSLFTDLGVQGEIDQSTFNQIVDKLVLEKDPDDATDAKLIESLIQMPELSGINQLISYCLKNRTSDADARSAVASFFQTTSKFNDVVESAASENAETQNEVNNGSADEVVWVSGQYKVRKEDGYSGDPAPVFDANEIIQKFFRERMFTDPGKADGRCRERLSVYQLIHNTLWNILASDPGIDFNDSGTVFTRLVEALVKEQLGFDYCGDHPGDITTAAIRKVVAAQAMAEYMQSDSNGKPRSAEIKTKEDYDAFVDAVKNIYRKQKDLYDKAFKAASTRGTFQMQKTWNLAEWGDNLDQEATDKMVYSCISEMDASIFGIYNTATKKNIEPGKTAVNDTIEVIAHGIVVNEETALPRYVGRDGKVFNEHSFQWQLMKRFATQENVKAEQASAEIEKTIDDTIKGLTPTLQDLERQGYDYDNLTAQQNVGLLEYVNALAYWAGRKDFVRAKWHTFQEFMADVRRGGLARYLLSTDQNTVINALLTLTFRSKLGRMVELMQSLLDAHARHHTEAELTRIKAQIEQEVSRFRGISPLYNSIAEFLYINGLQLDVSEEELYSRIEYLLDRDNGVLSTLTEITDSNGNIKSKETLLGDLFSIGEQKSMLSPKALLAYALEGEADSLDMQTPASRNRKATTWALRALQDDDNFLRVTANQTWATLDSLKENSGNPRFNSDLMEALELHQQINNTTVSEDALLFLMDTAGEILKGSVDKTRAVPAGTAFWERGSIASLGYSATELQNINSNTLSTPLLRQNPQLAATLILTNYIAEHGGIWISTIDGKMMYFANRNELVATWSGKAVDDREGITIDHLKAICEKCPRMINMISPVSTVFTDVESFSSDCEVRRNNYIENIASDLLGETYQGKQIEARKTSLMRTLRQNKWKVWLTTDYVGIRYLFAVDMNWDDFESKDLAGKREFVAKHLNRVAEQLDYYSRMSDDTEFAEAINRVLTQSEMAVTGDMLANARAYKAFVDAKSGEHLERIADQQTELFFEDTASKMLVSKTISTVTEKLNGTINDFLKHYNIITEDGELVDVSTEINSGKQYIENMMSAVEKLRQDLIDEIKNSGIADAQMNAAVLFAMLKRDENANIQRLYEEAFRRLTNSNIGEIVSAVNNLIESRKTQISSLRNLNQEDKNQILTELENLRNAFLRLGAYGAENNIPQNTSIYTLLQSQIYDGKNVDTTLPLLISNTQSQYYSKANLKEFLRHIKKQRKATPFERYMNIEHKHEAEDLIKKLEEASSLAQDDYMKANEDIKAQVRLLAFRYITSKLLYSTIGIQLDQRTNLEFVMDLDTIIGDVREKLCDPEWKRELQEAYNPVSSKETDRKQVDLSISLTKNREVLRLSSIMADILKGNVERGVTMNALERLMMTSMGDYPANLHLMESINEEAYNNRTYGELFRSFNAIREDPDGDFKMLFGRYKDPETGEWKQLSPARIALWAQNSLDLWDKPLVYYTLEDDSCGFDTTRMLPSSSGKPFNQFLNILAKAFVINSAEALNLKTAKNLKAFLCASFSNSVPEEQALQSNCFRRGEGIDQNTLPAWLAMHFRDVKKQYTSVLWQKMQQGGRDALDMSFCDCKILADHLVQGCLVRMELNNGAVVEETVMLRDILTNRPILSEATMARIAEGGGIKNISSRVHISSVFEINTLFSSSMLRYARINTPAGHMIDMSDNRMWGEAFSDTAATWKLNLLTDKNQIQDELTNIFSRADVRRSDRVDMFKYPHNSYHAYMKASHPTGKVNKINKVAPATKEGLKEASKNLLGQDTQYTIGRIFYDGSVSGGTMDNNRQFKTIESHRDELDDGWLGNKWYTMVLDGNSLKAAIDYARKTSSKLLVPANLKGTVQSIFNAGYVTVKTEDVNLGQAGSYVSYDFVSAHSYTKATLSAAEYFKEDGDSMWYALSPEIESEDGAGVTQDGCMKKLAEGRFSLAKKHYIHDFKRYGNEDHVKLITNRADVLALRGNSNLSVSYGLDEINDRDAASRVAAERALDDFFDDVANGKLQPGNNISTVATSPMVCVGIREAVFPNGSKYYIPVFVETDPSAKVTATLENNRLVIDTNLELYGQRVYEQGVVKIYIPSLALKVTVNLDRNQDPYTKHYAVLGDGETIQELDVVLKEVHNGNKTLTDAQIAETYSRYVRDHELSLFYEKSPSDQDAGQVRIRDIYGEGWNEEEITYFLKDNSGQRYDKIIWEIANGRKKFNNIDEVTAKYLQQIAVNSILFSFDFKYALSGIVVDFDPSWAFTRKSADSYLIKSDYVTKKAGYYTFGLVFNNLVTPAIQDVFHAISSKDFQSARKKSDGSETFDIEGRMRVKWQRPSQIDENGNEIPGEVGYTRMYVTAGPFITDETQAALQHSYADARVGNKPIQMGRFSNPGTDYTDVRIEAYKEFGLLGQMSQYMNDTKLSSDYLESMNQERFISYGNFVYESVGSDEVMYRVWKKQERSKMVKEFGMVGSIPIKDNEGNTISFNRKSTTEFENEFLQRMKDRFCQKTGWENMACETFIDILKFGLCYTKGQADDQIVFYEKNISDAIDNMIKRTNETGLPFNGEPVFRAGEGYARYSMPIMSKNLAMLFFENCKATQDKCASIDAMYDLMLENFKSVASSIMMSDDVYRRTKFFEVARFCVDGTKLEGNAEFRLGIASLTIDKIVDLMKDTDLSIFGPMFKSYPDFEQKINDNIQRTAERIEVIKGRKYASYKLSSKGNLMEIFKTGDADNTLAVVSDRLCTLRQTMALTEPMLVVPAVAERVVMGTPTRMLIHLGLIDKNGAHIGPYRSGLSKYMTQEERTELVKKIKDVSKRKDARRAFGAIRGLSFRGDFDYLIEDAIKAGNIDNFLKEAQGTGLFAKISNFVFDYASGKNLMSDIQVDIFLSEFFRLASLDNDYRWVFESGWLQGVLEEDPDRLILECFNSKLRPLAVRAFNVAMKGDAAQRTIWSVLFQEFGACYPAARLFITTCICPFFQYGVNVSGRALNAFLPMSTFNWLLLNHLKDSKGAVPGLYTLVNGEKKNVTWEMLNLDELQTSTSLQEALMLDMLHIGVTGMATLLVAMSGVLEPPDDDDKWCNVDEWTFLGHRIAENWWIQDILGPTLGMAAMWKSALMGKPNFAVFMNNVARCMYANPLMRSGDIVNMVIDPYGSYMESYYKDLETFSKATDGKPSGMDVLSANLGIFSMNWLTSFCTPSILKEIYQVKNPYEVSYKMIYEENERGELTEAGKAGKTQYTTYFDQKLRQATRKNPTLAFLMDHIFAPDANTGYNNMDMPRTVYYDPAQMDSFKRLSIYTTDSKGNEVLKSDAELNAIALEVIVTLQSYENMSELTATGFAIPYDTLRYVSSVVWDIAKGNDDFYASLIENGTLDPYTLGDGDYEAGKVIADRAAELYNQNYSYWKSFYYDKLWSDDIKRGLVKYNRYNTTYAKDANGEWYATGLRKNYSNLFSPVLTAPGSHSEMLNIDSPDSTMGWDEDWDTRSVVTGESTGERALMPHWDKIQTPDWDSLGGTGSNGYGYGYGGYGSRGGGGGGGYSSGGSFRYNPPNYNFATSSPYVVGADIPTVRTANLQYTNRDYLRPGFETKGSRKAYKREDI